MTAFALIGAAGYIAPRHMKAIKALGGDLQVAFDPNDSVGILDSYFPKAEFFTQFELFDQHVDKSRRRGQAIDYVSICSPNYLHDSHILFGLRSDTDVICEKPLVLNPWELDGIADMEKDTGRKVNTILQLRLHPAIVALKKKVAESNRRHSVDLTYIASRGRWYHASWKGEKQKSGGVATNIGVHFFDMLAYVFGPLESQVAHLREPARAGGFLSYQKADVRWFLSVDQKDLPKTLNGQRTTYRSLLMDGDEVEFSDGFTDLHTSSYEKILKGEGYGVDDVRFSIEVVSAFRTAAITRGGELHPVVADRLKG
jgi:UDP-N-acetyl-2-amino-2-deoxyglucuronate dehydrogenase